LADADLPRTGDAALMPSEDLRLGILPDCGRLLREAFCGACSRMLHAFNRPFVSLSAAP
jgi:hypothetical protein